MAEGLAIKDTPARRRALDRLIGYFANKHTERIDYRGRLASGDAIGSGAIEGAAQTLGLRSKARGARWRHTNVRSMAALICARKTEQWGRFWGQPT